MVVCLNVESPGNHPKLVMFKWAAEGRCAPMEDGDFTRSVWGLPNHRGRMDRLSNGRLISARYVVQAKLGRQVRERVFRQKAFGSFLALGQELAMLPRSAMILRSSRNKKTTDESRSEKCNFVQIPLCSAGPLFEVWSSFCRPWIFKRVQAQV